MAAFTASALERVCQCPASAALPQVLSSDEDGVRGTQIHAYLRRRIQGWDIAHALELVPEPWRQTCNGIDVRRLISGWREVEAETAYALDVSNDTAVGLGSAL